MFFLRRPSENILRLPAGSPGDLSHTVSLGFIYLFIHRGEGRKKERERNINVWLPLTHPTRRNLAHNPGMCPDWESNQ